MSVLCVHAGSRDQGQEPVNGRYTLAEREFKGAYRTACGSGVRRRRSNVPTQVVRAGIDRDLLAERLGLSVEVDDRRVARLAKWQTSAGSQRLPVRSRRPGEASDG